MQSLILILEFCYSSIIISILKHFISKVRDKYPDRYAHILQSENTMKTLEQNLIPGVRDICENRNFTLDKYVSVN